MEVTVSGTMTLTQEQLDSFHANGIPRATVRSSQADELDLYRREYDAEFAKANAGRRRATNLAVAFDADEETRRSPSTACSRSSTVRAEHPLPQAAVQPKILDVVEDLIGPNIMLFHDQALFKPAHHGGAVTWHQDNDLLENAGPQALVSCWITLDDATRENGAMLGNPRQPPQAAVARQDGEERRPCSTSRTRSMRAKAVRHRRAAGGCMFHHCQTLHYTQPNETPNQRPRVCDPLHAAGNEVGQRAHQVDAGWDSGDRCSG
jgi:ectoine hydroxylase-related dioxygenase (phytanoyl-CoA dioxygenase family)